MSASMRVSTMLSQSQDDNISLNSDEVISSDEDETEQTSQMSASINVPAMLSESDQDEDSEEGISSDEDEAILKAYADNKLKPGLHNIKPFIKKEFKNDIAGQKQALQTIKLNLPWVESLDHVTDPAPITAAVANLYPGMDLAVDMPPRGKPREKVEKDLSKDDFRREMFFFRQAQASVLHCIPQLHALGVATKRPEDYFAQMAKSDDHMKKIRERLLTEHLTIQRKEKAKHLREAKIYSKEVQRETLQERQRQKKAMQKAVKLHNKGKTQSMDKILNPDTRGKQQFGKRKNSQNRNMKNKKYGMGGKRSGERRNDAESSANIAAFKVGKHTDKKKRKHIKNKGLKQKRS